MRSRSLVAAAILLPAIARADMWAAPASYQLEYRADRPSLVAKAGQHVRVWIPYPATNADQSVQAGEIDSPWTYRRTSDALGNQMISTEGEAPAGRPFVFRAALRRVPSHGVPASASRSGSADDPTR